jgi:hypothetical protein
MRIDQYRTEPTDPQQYAAWMRMIQREAWRYQDERETQRRLESDILNRADQLPQRVDSLRARHLRECAGQIRDHRANGNYTTIHR